MTLSRVETLGVPVVLVTDILDVALADRVKTTLVAPRGTSGMIESLATTLVVLDALMLGLATLDRPRSLDSLGQVDDLRAQIVGSRIDVARAPHETT